MELRQICTEILKEAKKEKINDLKSFNKVKLKVLQMLNYPKIPKNATIASMASEKDRKDFKNILSMKPVRTISGVAPIALMTDPYPCPHTIKGIGPCTYCPGGPGSVFGDVPQSYTGKEPSTRRAIRNHYDPYLGVFNRLEHYVAMGSVPEKCDVILQGGTFPFSPWIYQEYFVKYLLKAMNDFSRLFYGKKGLDKKKFNLFFEMPANIEDDARTERIHKKLFFIKNLDLDNKKTLSNINNLFFNNKNTNNNIAIIKNNPIINNKINNGENLIKNNKKNYNNEKSSNGPVSDANLIAMKKVREKVNWQDNPKITLEQMQKDNETAKIRCVGLTIETKSDYGKLLHGNQMLKLGCTRVEIGIQSIYEEVLEKTNRGNTVQDNIDSIRILKDLGFKINAHYMPGLPLTTKKMDRKGLKALFENPDYRPDMLKIYPCMVMPGTGLYDDYKSGKFKPLSTKEAAELIAEMFSYAPEWVRVMRVQRDIPTYATSAGVDRTNLRQYAEKIMEQKRIKSRDIRSREAGLNFIKNKKINIKNLKIKITEYEASNGKEFFIAAEDEKNDILFGYCRLRFPSEFLRPEITKNSALVRELHVYSAAVEIGKTSDDSFQHRGIGRQLLKKAEEIAKNNNKDKMVVISGIGTREYFRKFNYELEGPYMVKKWQI
ncbi:tRNA uridine(34) 5-carboxymethylaminomethyl modification radical SAM/GNAT enzyme Elp3 [Candidatus Woesearchaeota archaeon]|nr:tRNA uridine(34) 5-carboxymethylaminomethyl modification radical SAM/GNAT enzyme Elp3 [Candidatus Woesearchaeota archaeon]